MWNLLLVVAAAVKQVLFVQSRAWRTLEQVVKLKLRNEAEESGLPASRTHVVIGG